MTMPITIESAGPVPRRRRLAARLAVALARVLIRLKPQGLRRVLGLFSRGARPASAARALAAREAVVSVSVRCAGLGCLQRSIATALLCRLSGTWPDWCTGVRVEPFRAHAWVEADGKPVGEHAEIALFHKVMSVSARR